MILRFLRVVKLTWNIIIPFSFLSVLYISLLSLLWKIKEAYDITLLFVCLCIPLCQLLNAWTNFSGTCYVYHGTCACLTGVLHKTLRSACVSVARQPLGRHVPAATNTSNNRRIVEGVVLCTARLVSKENLWVCLCIPPVVAGQRLGKHVPAATKCWRRRFLCCSYRTKESRRLVLPSTSCFIYQYPTNHKY
jgi:hypothetical protein